MQRGPSLFGPPSLTFSGRSLERQNCRRIMNQGQVLGCSGDLRPDPTTVLGGQHHDALLSHFEARVKASPDRLAIIDTARVLSYRELDCLSNRVANCLRAHAV